MRFSKLAALGFAALLLTTGVAAAAPGNAPVDAQASNDTAADAAGNDSAVQGPPADAGNADDRGPSVSLPDQVPDHVSEIHDAINGFLDGTVDSLGDAVSDLTPSDEDADESDEETGNATDATTESDGESAQ
ncbi:hypothetical protein G9464_04350 [Halostella sp. JP-L12]|uniref:hypothetical protein n=1 Tax=Halostella TaxID=1843185 RepID=UPI000EF7E062|nr:MULTISPECIES: hypothetical protein [Halostella]NHN46826.1 hypothetical protein [Halostella sp. JP-L12]